MVSQKSKIRKSKQGYNNLEKSKRHTKVDTTVKNAVRRVERKVIVFKQEAKAVSDSVFVRSEIRKEDVQEEVKSEHKSKAKSDIFGFKWMFLCLLLLCIVFVFLYLKRSNVLSFFKDVLIRILKLFK